MSASGKLIYTSATFINHNRSNMSSLIITTEEVVKKKLDLLDSLSNVRHTYELMKVTYSVHYKS